MSDDPSDDESAPDPVGGPPANGDSLDEGAGGENDDVPTPEDVREELYGGRDGTGGVGGIDTQRSVGQFDEGVVELLSWGLDTETRARIYVRLRQRPWATSEELAEATGLYPSTVREALAALHGEAVVERRKRTGTGAGNDPYEYTAIAPSELVGTLAERLQDRLNAVFDIDRPDERSEHTARRSEPVTITVRDADDASETDDGNDNEGDDTDDEDGGDGATGE